MRAEQINTAPPEVGAASWGSAGASRAHGRAPEPQCKTILRWPSSGMGARQRFSFSLASSTFTAHPRSKTRWRRQSDASPTTIAARPHRRGTPPTAVSPRRGSTPPHRRPPRGHVHRLDHACPATRREPAAAGARSRAARPRRSADADDGVRGDRHRPPPRNQPGRRRGKRERGATHLISPEHASDRNAAVQNPEQAHDGA